MVTSVLGHDGSIAHIDVAHAVRIDDVGFKVEFRSGGGELQGVCLGVRRRQLVAVTLHINQLTCFRPIDINIFVGVFPLESQHIFVNRIPVEHIRLSLELVALEQNFGSLIVGFKMPLSGFEVNVGFVIVGGKDELVRLVEIKDAHVGGIGEELVMLETE